jgi:hypothetical protein
MMIFILPLPPVVQAPTTGDAATGEMTEVNPDAAIQPARTTQREPLREEQRVPCLQLSAPEIIAGHSASAETVESSPLFMQVHRSQRRPNPDLQPRLRDAAPPVAQDFRCGRKAPSLNLLNPPCRYACV